VQQLLEIGADPAAPNKHGLMPLHLACMGRVTSDQQLSQLRGACNTADVPPNLQVCKRLSSAFSIGLQGLSCAERAAAGSSRRRSVAAAAGVCLASCACFGRHKWNL
jgi:hypothetical protein